MCEHIISGAVLRALSAAECPREKHEVTGGPRGDLKRHRHTTEYLCLQRYCGTCGCVGYGKIIQNLPFETPYKAIRFEIDCFGHDLSNRPGLDINPNSIRLCLTQLETYRQFKTPDTQ